jgi:hypothetical protein
MFKKICTRCYIKGLGRGVCNCAERKSLFIARATAHFDTPEIRKQAGEKWEEANK